VSSLLTESIPTRVETVIDGEMPPWRYELNHPRARLSEAELQALVEGLAISLGVDIDEDGD
jgi:hypothetical protein